MPAGSQGRGPAAVPAAGPSAGNRVPPTVSPGSADWHRRPTELALRPPAAPTPACGGPPGAAGWVHPAAVQPTGGRPGYPCRSVRRQTGRQGYWLRPARAIAAAAQLPVALQFCMVNRTTAPITVITERRAITVRIASQAFDSVRAEVPGIPVRMTPSARRCRWPKHTIVVPGRAGRAAPDAAVREFTRSRKIPHPDPSKSHMRRRQVV